MEELVRNTLEFYNGKNVLVTGDTGFKGSWLCRMLLKYGANVTGYALAPPTDPSLFEEASLKDHIRHIEGDVRDIDRMLDVFSSSSPDVVFHLAAQPIVREGYRLPRYTYETNVMGTVNLMECVRMTDSIQSVINVTTDKVYYNRETPEGYRENELLDGYDPYSNSKSCSELVTGCYVRSFLASKNIPVSTMRAGNVIGGGDHAKDRIVPDCVRSSEKNEEILIRNPYSVRPYQHVLEPLFAYMMVAAYQAGDRKYAGSYNVGPDEDSCITTGQLADMFCALWGEGASWKNICEENAVHEAGLLTLNCDKLKSTFGWTPVWNVRQALEKVCEFTKALDSGKNACDIMDEQISSYIDMAVLL